jgi:hypothetical protein
MRIISIILLFAAICTAAVFFDNMMHEKERDAVINETLTEIQQRNDYLKEVKP